MKLQSLIRIILIIVSAVMFLPFISHCQEFDSASWNEYKTDETINEYGRSIQMLSKPERPDWLISTDSIPVDDMSTGEWRATTSLFSNGATTKIDTIEVKVLCEYRGNRWDQFASGDVYFAKKRQERTLEWKTWNEGFRPDRNGVALGIAIIKSDWVVTSTHWLDPIDGCYQLIPLQQDKQ